MSGEVAYLLERVGRADGPERQGEPPTDRARFEQLVRRQHAKQRRFAAALVGGMVADDVLQEAYIKAYRRLPQSFANEAHESSWLYRVVYRCCLDELRRTKRLRESGRSVVRARRRAERRARRRSKSRCHGRAVASSGHSTASRGSG